MDLYEEIEKLEKEYEEYREADMNKEASIIKTKLNKVREKLEYQELKKELAEFKKIKFEVRKCHQFIKLKGLEPEYNRFHMDEI